MTQCSNDATGEEQLFSDGGGLGEPPIAKQYSYSGGQGPNSKSRAATSYCTSVLLELSGRNIAERRLQPFLVIDPLQKFSDRGASFVEIAVFVAITSSCSQRFHERFAGRIVIRISLAAHADLGRRAASASRCRLASHTESLAKATVSKGRVRG